MAKNSLRILVNKMKEEELYLRTNGRQTKKTLLKIVNQVMDERGFGAPVSLPACGFVNLSYRPSHEGICIIAHIEGEQIEVGQDYMRNNIYADVRLTARGMRREERESLYGAVKKLNVEWFQL